MVEEDLLILWGSQERPKRLSRPPPWTDRPFSRGGEILQKRAPIRLPI